jgi:hypothetical protein
MKTLQSLLIFLLANIIGISLFALLSGWLLTKVLFIPLDQALWLTLGVLVLTRYALQTFMAMPVIRDVTVLEVIVSDVFAAIILSLSAVLGWLLLNIVTLDLTIFQTTLLFAITLTSGMFFLLRIGTGGVPGWMTMPGWEEEEDEEEDEYIPPPPPKTSRRRGRASKRWAN